MAGSRSLGQLTLDLVAKTGSFEQGMDRASRRSKKASDDISKHAKVWGAAIGAAAVAAVAGLTIMVNKQRELIDQTAKTAQQLDTTYTSIANLGRAGELGGVGMEKIEAASRQLNLNLGRAIQGTDAQVKAFDRLGLSAQKVADMPLDQRIATINQALRDNVQASERAAVAADIFGARNATAMQQLDPGTIAEAARQVEIFGLNLSDVDAAKVEMANDAMSTFGMLSDGAAKQLTVQLAPILKAIGDLFLEAADEAGGMGNAIERAVDRAVTGLAFVMDAGDGVKRAFQVVADIIVGMLATAQYRALELAASVGDAISNIPGVDIDTSGMKQSANEARMIAAEAAANIGRTLDEPLAGTKFKQFVADARESAEAAAEAVVAGRDAAKLTGEAIEESQGKGKKAVRETVDQVEKQITALERAAITWGMTADEVQVYDLSLQGATGSQLAYAQSLLDTVTGLEAQKKAKEDFQKLMEADAEQVERVIESLKTEEQKLADSYENRRQIILDSVTLAEEEKTALMLELEQQRQDQLAQMEAQRTSMMLTNYQQLFDGIGGLSEAFAGKQTGISRAMFAASKAFAIADAIVKIQQGIASAAAIPFPANIPAMASVAAATGSIVSTIQSTQMKGMAHDGIDKVPQTGTWLLEEGERVTTAETSAKLDKTLSDIQQGDTGGAPIVNLYEDSSKAGQVNSRNDDGRNVIDIFVSDIMGDGRAQKAISQKFGLQGVGR